MPTHEDKRCPRCNTTFECKTGSIHQCDCTKVVLSLEERAFIEDKYKDCLCLTCLKDLKNKYVFFKEKYFG